MLCLSLNTLASNVYLLTANMVQLQRLVINPSQLSGQQCALTPEQQHYLYRVLRLSQGDRFIAMDGQGHWWLAALAEPSSDAQILEALVVETELPISVTLAVALPKGSGMDDIVRQATELGVASIVPVLSDRTVLNPSAQKVERWRRIAQEAAEQSERQIVPTVLDPTPFPAFLQTTLHHSLPHRYICVTRRSAPMLLDCLIAAAKPNYLQQPILIATGPEGGWTDTEVERAIAEGYQPVSLGRRILRAITAPVMALSLVAATVESLTPQGGHTVYAEG